MPTNNTSKYKDPLWITAGLEAALEKEKDKYKKCPVMRDMVPDFEAIQGWGYVVAGYFLIEMSFKAFLNIRKKKVPKSHSLSTLFKKFDNSDKSILREFYFDYKVNIGGFIGNFPFETLDEFLLKLDGDKDEKGGHVGSFDWRYFLIEERQSQEMPLVSVDYIHEIVFGCIRSIEYAINGRFEPSRYTFSKRMKWNSA